MIERLGLDAVLFENPNFKQDFRWRMPAESVYVDTTAHRIPDGVTSRVESDTALAEVRAAKDLACVDVVIATTLPSGEPAVLLSRRSIDVPFGGLWWVYGGSLGAYQDILVFIAQRAEKECGVPAVPRALIGVYRTCAEDQPQSTLQPCFAAYVDYDALVRKMSTDDNHESVSLFTESELDNIPSDGRHWYPIQVAKIVLQAMVQSPHI